MNIYVASSWRNDFQPSVVKALRKDGHTVYDFKDSEGFNWSEVDPKWEEWSSDIPRYLDGLISEPAIRGFERDMKALENCDACVYVMPCGVSASLELGWAVGRGKRTYVYIPALKEPDLMVKIAGLVTEDFAEIRVDLMKHETIRNMNGTEGAKAQANLTGASLGKMHGATPTNNYPHVGLR